MIDKMFISYERNYSGVELLIKANVSKTEIVKQKLKVLEYKNMICDYCIENNISLKDVYKSYKDNEKQKNHDTFKISPLIKYVNIDSIDIYQSPSFIDLEQQYNLMVLDKEIKQPKQNKKVRI